jgi:metal-responsive CopG/Arc/MetJ family transcriptional regulator
MDTINISLPESMKKRLDEESRDKGISKSEITRTALQKHWGI